MDAGSSQGLPPSDSTLPAEHRLKDNMTDPGRGPAASHTDSAAASLTMADSPLRALAQANSNDARESRPFVLFMGSAPELLQMLDLTDYAPRLTALPVSLPAVFQQLCFWTFSVSAALALVNMLPAVFLDGAAALTAALDLRTIDLPASIALPMEPRSLCSSPALRVTIRRRVLFSCTAMFGSVLVIQLLRVWLRR